MNQAAPASSSMRPRGQAGGLAGVSAALLVLLAAPALAANPALSVSNPWIRFLTPQTPAAGYFTLSNSGAMPAVLSGASSPDCGQLMLHRSMDMSGMAEMKMVATVTVPAHGSVTFQPGGYHLMCTSPTAAMAVGKYVPVTLRFKDGSTLAVDFPVYGAKGK